MIFAMSICHDLHEGHVPGCGKCLSLNDMQKARDYIAQLIRNNTPPPSPPNLESIQQW